MSDQADNSTQALRQAAPPPQEPAEASVPHLVGMSAGHSAPGEPDAERLAAEPGTALPDEPRPELSNASIYSGRSVIGLDIGARTLKIVHLQTTGSILQLVDARVSDLPPMSDPERFDAISQTVDEFVAGARPRVKAACCAVSGDEAATVCCSLPKMSDKDLAQAVRWKVAEDKSFDAEKAVVDYHILGGKGAAGNVPVIVAAAPPDIAKLDALFPGEHPRLSVVVTEPLAAENIIMAAYHAQERHSVAVLDMGTTASQLSVIGEHGLEFTREIPVGGDSVTAALAGTMTLEAETIEISRQAAGQLKRNYTIGQTTPVRAAGLTVPGSRVLGAIRPVLERLASEIVRSLQYYGQSHSLAQVEALFTCGGAATLGGLAEFFTHEIRLPTTLMDPWRLIGLDVPAHVGADPALFATATGAAIHDSSRLNLVPAHIRARRVISAVRAGSLVASACALVALLSLSWAGHSQKSNLLEVLAQKQESIAPMEQIAAKIGQATEQRTELQRRQDLLRSLGVGRPLHAAILKELSNIMPEGTYLRELAFTNQNGVRRLQLHVDIYRMPAATPLALKERLVAGFERSPFFVNVSFSPAQHREPNHARPPDEALALSCQILGFPGS